jgi:hypothetical protein
MKGCSSMTLAISRVSSDCPLLEFQQSLAQTIKLICMCAPVLQLWRRIRAMSWLLDCLESRTQTP